MPIDLGTTTEVQWTAVAGLAVTLTVTKPDGTLLDPAPTVSADYATYTASLLCDQPGRYVLTWTDTTIGEKFVDAIEVWPADPRFLISLDDAMTSLRWSDAQRATTRDRESLLLFIAAATEVIEDITGAVLARTVVQPSDGGRTGVALWERPTEIVSVTVDGKPFTRFTPNLNAAIVYTDDGRFPPGRQNVVITYRAGGDQLSPSIQLGARELVRHLWQIGQQASSAPAPSAAPADPRQVLTRSGFAVPNRVIELIGNHHALPGIA